MFKVGQKVWCVVQGEGEITDVEMDSTSVYPVSVKFSNGKTDYYTKDGRMFKDSMFRALYFSPPIISAATEPPFVPTLVGKMVAIQDNRYGGIIIEEIFDETVNKIFTDSFGNYRRKSDVTVYKLTPVTFED